MNRIRPVTFLFLLPFFVLTAAFFLYPLIEAARLAFFQTNSLYSAVFVGVDNFLFVLRDPVFYKALVNTLLYTAMSLGLQIPIALFLAIVLTDSRGRFTGVFRLMLFSPYLAGQIFVGILFSVLFAPHYGLFNQVLHLLSGYGLENDWLNDPRLNMWALSITGLWMYMGYNMIYFLAALQNVDVSLVEAARVDGAGRFRIFLDVTVPAIRPVLVFVVLTTMIGSLQMFELPYSLFKGFGANNSAMTIVGYMYQQGFLGGDLGIGAAVGWILSILIFVLSLAQIRANRGA